MIYPVIAKGCVARLTGSTHAYGLTSMNKFRVSQPEEFKHALTSRNIVSRASLTRPFLEGSGISVLELSEAAGIDVTSTVSDKALKHPARFHNGKEEMGRESDSSSNGISTEGEQP